MITEIYKPIDDECERSLVEIQSVLGSECYLAGLGKVSQDYSIPKGFNVVTDYHRCMYLLTSQSMGDKSSKKRGDKNFADVLDDAIDYLGYPTYERDEASWRMGYFKSLDKFKARDAFVKNIMEEAYERNKIHEFLLGNFKNISPKEVESFVKGHITQSTLTFLDILIRSAYFGGLKKWPVCEHLLRCYSIGGFPTGWVGALPTNGGKSSKCMQLLHFGTAAVPDAKISNKKPITKKKGPTNKKKTATKKKRQGKK